jgi:hypothetical protein
VEIREIVTNTEKVLDPGTVPSLILFT